MKQALLFDNLKTLNYYKIEKEKEKRRRGEQLIFFLDLMAVYTEELLDKENILEYRAV